MNRRNFLKLTGITSAAIMGAKTFADERDILAIQQCQVQCITSVIDNNHGHLLILPNPATPGTYSIQGQSRHPHFITLTGENIAELENTKRLETISTVDFGHEHGVTLVIGG